MGPAKLRSNPGQLRLETAPSGTSGISSPSPACIRNDIRVIQHPIIHVRLESGRCRTIPEKFPIDLDPIQLQSSRPDARYSMYNRYELRLDVMLTFDHHHEVPSNVDAVLPHRSDIVAESI
jgi:hypothetical protein